MVDTCIGFVCKEDLSKSNKYTTLAKQNINFWSKLFPVYVLTNNPLEFKNSNCKVILDTTYYSTFNRFDLLNKLQKKYKKSIYLDCDDLFTDKNLNLKDIPEGIHAYGNWPDIWGNLKKLDYFKVWVKNIEVEDNILFPCESVFILNTFPLWGKVYKEIVNLKPISRQTQLESTSNTNSHHGIERCEAIGIYVACKKLNFPLYLNSKFVEPLYKSLPYLKYN